MQNCDYCLISSPVYAYFIIITLPIAIIFRATISAEKIVLAPVESKQDEERDKEKLRREIASLW